jgi:hypothetical protein
MTYTLGRNQLPHNKRWNWSVLCVIVTINIYLKAASPGVFHVEADCLYLYVLNWVKWFATKGKEIACYPPKPTSLVDLTFFPTEQRAGCKRMWSCVLFIVAISVDICRSCPDTCLYSPVTKSLCWQLCAQKRYGKFWIEICSLFMYVMFFCTFQCNIILQHKTNKCNFSKLIF